jgi:hypothetical protein
MDKSDRIKIHYFVDKDSLSDDFHYIDVEKRTQDSDKAMLLSYEMTSQICNTLRKNLCCQYFVPPKFASVLTLFDFYYLIFKWIHVQDKLLNVVNGMSLKDGWWNTNVNLDHMFSLGNTKKTLNGEWIQDHSVIQTTGYINIKWDILYELKEWRSKIMTMRRKSSVELFWPIEEYGFPNRQEDELYWRLHDESTYNESTGEFTLGEADVGLDYVIYSDDSDNDDYISDEDW